MIKRSRQYVLIEMEDLWLEVFLEFNAVEGSLGALQLNMF
jgi:hypothetical protein